MLHLSPNILFTTMLPPTRLQAATDWWYLTPEHGQHISIYSVPALKFIAGKFGLHLSTDGSAFHLLSQKPVSSRLFKTVVHDRRASQVIRKFGRRKLRKGSLLMDDFRAVTGWKV